MFDTEVDLEADDVARGGLGAPRRKSCKLRFPPYQAGLEAYTGEIHDSIKNTHLQHDLKRHPSA